MLLIRRHCDDIARKDVELCRIDLPSQLAAGRDCENNANNMRGSEDCVRGMKRSSAQEAEMG